MLDKHENRLCQCLSILNPHLQTLRNIICSHSTWTGADKETKRSWQRKPSQSDYSWCNKAKVFSLFRNQEPKNPSRRPKTFPHRSSPQQGDRTWQYSTDAVFCLDFCAVSRQKLHPYHMRNIELYPKDLIAAHLDPNSEYSSFVQRSIFLTECKPCSSGTVSRGKTPPGAKDRARLSKKQRQAGHLLCDFSPCH